MDTLVSLMLVAPIGVMTIYLMSSRMQTDEARWLRKVLLVALAMRLAMAAMFDLLPATRYFHEDAEGYEAVGMLIARGWHNDGPPMAMLNALSQNFGYYYFSAGVYYVFGYFRPIVSMINGVVGVGLVFFVYSFARRFFIAMVARRAALLTAFVPSMILWSSVALKDTIMTFLVVVALYSYVSLRARFTAGALVGTVLPIIAMQPIRFYMIYILVFAMFASFLLSRGLSTLSGITKQLLVGGLLVGLLVIVGAASRVQEGVESISLEHVSTFRQGMASTAHSGFASDVDISTPGRAIAFLPIGAAVLLLSPFPWQFTSLRASFAAPEMFFWWSLLPALWTGIAFVVRHRAREASPVLLFTFALTVGYSLIHGNVGSGFRQRAQIFVFLFIFAAVGTFIRKCRRRGIDPMLLLEHSPDAASAGPTVHLLQTA